MSKELLPILEDFQGSEIIESEKIKGGAIRPDPSVSCRPEGDRTEDVD